eukprot:7050111-Prymnesium_polylepis.1
MRGRVHRTGSDPPSTLQRCDPAPRAADTTPGVVLSVFRHVPDPADQGCTIGSDAGEAPSCVHFSVGSFHIHFT